MSNAMEVNEANFSAEVLESEVPVLVDFWAPWCAPCRMMGPVLDKIAEKFAPGLKVVKLNTQDNSKMASDYNINSIPCFIIFEKGQEIKRFIGFMQEEVFAEELKALFAQKS
jgi:thioredoxin 1